jgi:preprotein translocase subunit SecG
MGALGIIFLVIMLLAGLVLAFFVLIQDDQGDGMGGLFGGSSTSAFGSRAGNALTKMTATLGIVFVLSALVVAFDIKHQHDSKDTSGSTATDFRNSYVESLETGTLYEADETEVNTKPDDSSTPEEEPVE